MMIMMILFLFGIAGSGAVPRPIIIRIKLDTNPRYIIMGIQMGITPSQTLNICKEMILYYFL